MEETLFDMIKIQKGLFIMGANRHKKIDAEYYEEPERRVFLDAFYMQKTTVTVEQWMMFINQTDYNWGQIDKISNFNIQKKHPITYVSWYDADRFTTWLRDTLGKNYSLPTEAQWEKACRGCNGQLYPLNKEYDWEEEFPRYVANTTPITLPVGHSPRDRSPFGCLDMWQNVPEWCLNWFDDDGEYYNDISTKSINPKGPTSGIYKVYRGGNPLSSGWPRCTYRGFARPEEYHAYRGFRVVLNP